MERVLISAAEPLERFAEWLAVHTNANEISRGVYRADAADFLRYANIQGTELTEITTGTVVDYLQERGYSKGATVNRKLFSLSRLDEFLAGKTGSHFLSTRNQRRSVLEQLGELELPDKSTVSEDEFLAMLERIKGYTGNTTANRFERSYVNARDTLAAVLFFRAGKRVNQVCALDEEDFSLEKTEEDLTVYAPEPYKITTGREKECLSVYKEELSRFKEEIAANEKALLISRFGARISPRSLRRGITIKGREGDRAITPTELRRSYLALRKTEK